MDGYGGYGGGGGDGGGFNGGGFVHQSQGGGADPSPGGRGGGKSGRPDSVIPVTVKALFEAVQQSALDDQVLLWGAELGNITLVAKIISVQDTPTQVMYKVDDGTGKCELKMWVDNDDPDAAAALKAELRPGTYVRCFGSLRSMQNTKSLVAYSLRPVADFNEVTFHNLEVIYVQKQLSAKNGVARAPAGGAPNAGAFAAAPPANAAYGGGGGYGAYAAPAPAAGGGGGAGAFTGDINADVAKVFAMPMGRGESGVSLQAVAQTLGGRYQAQAIREAVDKLVNDGVLYSTVDDQHFKSTAF